MGWYRLNAMMAWRSAGIKAMPLNVYMRYLFLIDVMVKCLYEQGYILPKMRTNIVCIMQADMIGQLKRTAKLFPNIILDMYSVMR